MFRHVVLWKFPEDSAPSRNRENAIKIKAGLEELVYEVHGILKIEVYIDPVRGTTSVADIFMDSVFEDRDAFDDYLSHPRHLAVKELVDSCVEERLSMDFMEEPESEPL